MILFFRQNDLGQNDYTSQNDLCQIIPPPGDNRLWSTNTPFKIISPETMVEMLK